MIRHGVARGTACDEQGDVDALRAACEMDECLEKHRTMVVLNPDDYRCWNLLKRHFLETRTDDVFRDQLLLTQRAIEANPKSYFAWHHRRFLLRHHDGDAEHERRLCSVLLSIDPRNFHCWNHCNAQGFKMPLDFSNYSSMCAHLTAADEAVYTDPDDEGAWRYFARIRESRRAGPFYARCGEGCVEIVFRDAFTGTACVNGEDFAVPDYVRCCRCVLGTAGTPHDRLHVLVGGHEYLLSPEEEPGLVQKILELSPRCVFALRERMRYARDVFERKRLAKELGRLDPLRRPYYDSLAERHLEIYAIRTCTPETNK